MKYPKKKSVHVVTHSHTDLGWQSTLEDYFDGTNLDYYKGSIHEMFDTVFQ